MSHSIFEELRSRDYLYSFEPVDHSHSNDVFDELFNAFSNYAVCIPNCGTCYSEPRQFYTYLNGLDAVSHVDPDKIAVLYWDSPWCCGIHNWKRFFPRMVQAGLFTSEDLDLFDRAIGAGMWAWPDKEQQAVRQVVCHAFTQWVFDKDKVPLSSMLEAGAVSRTRQQQITIHTVEIGRILFEALIICRIDVTSLLRWMTDIDNGRTRLLLCRMLSHHLSIWGWGLDRADDGGVKAYSDGCQYIICNLISEETLINWYLESEADAMLKKAVERAMQSVQHWSNLTIKPAGVESIELFVQSFNRSKQRYEELFLTE